MTVGRKFSETMSLWRTRSLSRSLPWGLRRSRVQLSLARLRSWKVD